jgi:peptidoglycan/LPS O-acetylase OafA/YrhL
MFFVISGSLITRLILKEQQKGKPWLAEFWVRRILRILPVSLFVVAVTLVAEYQLLLPDEYEEFAKSIVAQLILSNVFFWRSTGYLAGSADVKRCCILGRWP